MKLHNSKHILSVGRLQTIVAAVLGAVCVLAHAGAKTDGSVGAVQTLSGNFTIPQTLGTINGGNLFHSFQNFSINNGETATFTTTSALSNVISRVTGGTASTMNGLLKLDAAAGSAPNFYFINPSGVTFGAGASIDVPGAFHVSTANYLKFADGSMLHADLAKRSTFSSAAPEAFGFLGTTRASIIVNDGATLSTAPLQAMSLTAGDVEINNATVSTQSGDIRVLAAGAGALEVAMQGVLPSVYGDLKVLNGGRLYIDNIDAFKAGSLNISAGNLTVDGQGAASTTRIVSWFSPGASGNGGDIQIAATGTVSLFKGGQIQSVNASENEAGKIRVNAEEIVIDSQLSKLDTRIVTSTNSSGKGGDIDVTARGNLTILDRGAITAYTFSSADSGAIKVSATNLRLDGYDNSNYGRYAAINSGTVAGSGTSGSVDVSASENVFLLNGAQIRSATWNAGNVGAVRLQGKTILMDGDPNDTGSVSAWGSGVISQAYRSSSGYIGNIEVTATDAMYIRNGAKISAETYGSKDGNSRSIKVNSPNLTIKGCDCGNLTTGIYGGFASDVEVNVSDTLTLLKSGKITAYDSGPYSAALRVNAGTLLADGQLETIYAYGVRTGIEKRVNTNADVLPGDFKVNVKGKLSLLGGGGIFADNSGEGVGATVEVSADTIVIDGQGHIDFYNDTSRPTTGIISQARWDGAGGNLMISAAGDLSVLNSGIISASTLGQGNAGSVTVNAKNILIANDQSQIVSNADFGGTGNGGNVKVTAKEDLRIDDGKISADTYTSGNAGSVQVQARNIILDGDSNKGSDEIGVVTRISSGAWEGSTGNAGKVDVTATGALSLRNNVGIFSLTWGSGNAGSINVAAKSMDMAVSTAYDSHPNVSSEAWFRSTGNAGSINVSVAEGLVMRDGEISSQTLSTGSPGSVKVHAGSILLGNPDVGSLVTINSDSHAREGQSGNPGSVEVTADGILSLQGASEISANTRGPRDAGSITVNADRILIGTTSTSIVGGIKSDTFGAGNAGSIVVNARTMTLGRTMTGGYWSGMAISTTSCCNYDDHVVTGNAGRINVNVSETLSVLDAVISSATDSSGRAGAVTVKAGSLFMSGETSRINARAGEGSSGQTGSLLINVASQLSLENKAHLSIKNEATVTDPASLSPSSLSVTAPVIILKDAYITAASTGNAAASNIDIKYTDRMVVDPSYITTSAVDGNGGKISIAGSGPLFLDRSQITTSVTGTANGNGGDIAISAPVLAMNTGFIQANTSAKANGGNVSIDVQSLLTSGNSLARGGSIPLAFDTSRFGYNVIQAAAPDGVSGAVILSSPQIDLSGSLNKITAQILDFGNLNADLCRIGGGSSLTALGRGGVIPAATALLSAW